MTRHEDAVLDRPRHTPAARTRWISPRSVGRATVAALGLAVSAGALWAAPLRQPVPPPAPQPALQCPPEPEPLAQEQLLAQAKDRGLLWTLQRDGRTSYLYASLHLGRPSWAAPGPRLKAALDQVDALALELDPLDPAAWRMPPLPELSLDAGLRDRMAAQARAVCVAPQAVEALHPLLRLSTFTLMRARTLGMDVRYGQEMLLSRWARDRSLPVLALETLQSQLEVLLPEDPDEARHELHAGLRQLERPKPLMRMLNELVTAWERGDLRRLSQYESWCDCVADARDRAALTRLNDGRNPALAERVSNLHRKDQTLLVAVGALHMTGPQALPDLLRQRGFEVTLVHPPSAR
ncbi:TraB/GumN family protein [Roseateles amylovorans]|uniref:TraB/GumN family protein n=1 Tax=Roseateles amylovorans TaxID=2978473 RepID=A0ABY6B024_9BURK|nr:TraB/GumN family protein [Roseateles amylovorans]UXH78764.1 TraB/GumN family protein [Roseateles amylovorans]